MHDWETNGVAGRDVTPVNLSRKSSGWSSGVLLVSEEKRSRSLMSQIGRKSLEPDLLPQRTFDGTNAVLPCLIQPLTSKAGGLISPKGLECGPRTREP